MRIISLFLFVSTFLASSCAIGEKDIQSKKYRDPNVSLSSSQLNDFKVSYPGQEHADSGKVAQNAVETAQVPAEKTNDRPLTAPRPALPQDTSVTEALPFEANSGECYAKVEIPAVFKDETLTYVKEEASYRFEVSDPEYTWEDKNVQIKEPEENIEVIPAEYKWIDDEVYFETDGGQVSAKVRKKIMVNPPKVIKHQILAEYQTIKIKKLVKPAEIDRVEIPPVYGSVTLPVEGEKAHFDWRQVLCATEITTDLVYQLQNALQQRNYYSDVVDGIFGSRTLNAVQEYQKDHKLAVGQITIETLEKLGIERY